jgi:nicotinamide riboside kinase
MALIKIAFVGTHGTGKTTLCYELAAWMKKREVRVDMVREIARRCPLPINQETTLEAQSWILHRQIAEEIQIASEQDVVICDRSVLDNYAYLTQRLGPQPVLDELVRHWMKTYSHLFKVPIVTAPAFDGTRDTSAAFQRAIDLQVDGLIERFGIAVHPLDPADRAGWIDAVARVMGALPKPPQIGLFQEEESPPAAPSA